MTSNVSSLYKKRIRSAVNNLSALVFYFKLKKRDNPVKSLHLGPSPSLQRCEARGSEAL